MKSGLTAICALLVLAIAGAVAAQDQPATRTWAFGWDDGLTLRHRLGPWQVGLSAGPNDHLSDSYRQSFDPDLADSLQGTLTQEGTDRDESGFVRLSVTRDVAAHRSLGLAALASAGYAWSNQSRDDRNYDLWDADWREGRRLDEWDRYDVHLGARLSWQPVPFLTLETEFGLAYQWRDFETEQWQRWPGDAVWSRTITTGRDQSFTDFGPYDLTYDVQILLWF